jgi:hypothetical protein
MFIGTSVTFALDPLILPWIAKLMWKRERLIRNTAWVEDKGDQPGPQVPSPRFPRLSTPRGVLSKALSLSGFYETVKPRDGYGYGRRRQALCNAIHCEAQAPKMIFGLRWTL